ncbi:hypothetical protein C1X05_10595 [Laceyella sacchari]|uniref:Adhesin n=2 Tax=Laceyella TaxID=292635 RepID=A0AA45WKX1_9BACL|nr:MULTISPECIES: DUF4097 family beta strand repeat-containing protein [Laceyella]AUS09227.1 hypothetical protein C1X05_10595 [Laceyella sacchari]PRZ13575.1 putative adhesin [Laceyella sediminis]SMP09171.1 Putative adhesin [Laceyella tengchongensis]
MRKTSLIAGLVLSLTVMSGCSLDLDDPDFDTNNSNSNSNIKLDAGAIDTSKKGQVQKSFLADNVSVLDIYSKEIGVQLHHSDSNEIKVLLTNVDNDTKLDANVSGDTLQVKMGAGPSVFGLNTTTPTLHIYVPKKSYQSIKLHSQNANFTAENLEAAELDLNTNEGDFKLNGFKGNQLTGKTAHGNFNLQQIDAPFSISSSSGAVNVSVANGIIGNSQIRSSFGDVKVNVGTEAVHVNLRSDQGISSSFSAPAVKDNEGVFTMEGALNGGGGSSKLTINTEGRIKLEK